MNDWLLLIAASIVGSLVSLVGGVLLLTKHMSVQTVQRIAVPFAAGALLAAAFLDLLPEAFDHAESVREAAVLVLSGFIVFFVLERFLGWFHHHHDHHEVSAHSRRAKSARSLIVVGDTLHNAIDGLVIGATFLVDPALGVVTTIAIAAHEIPQEIGDFGVLLALGMRRRTVLIVNVISALATVVAAIAVYGLGTSLTSLEPMLLALAAGMFIYIAASDLIPTIHDEPKARVANYQTLILLFGILFVGFTTTIAHGFIEGQSGDIHTETKTHDHHE